MGVIPVSPPTVDLAVGAVWEMAVMVVDVDGVLVDVAPTCEVTAPDGSTATPDVDSVTTGVFRAAHKVTLPGRYVAQVDHEQGAAAFSAYANAVVTAAGMPDLDKVKTYLKIELDDTSQDVEVQDALTAEEAAQRSVCRVPAAYPADLGEALKRRVARNLALRNLPLAVLRGDGEAGDTVLPGNDPEVRRLERPWRKLRMG